MAGHSKWKQIKHYKAATDAKRGAQFTKLIREITMAAKLAGGDPAHNPRLRTAIDAAKAGSMPKENIERAIKKGTGELEGVHYTEVTYEGYGPGGVAILISALSDNPTRTVAEIRHKLTRLGGNLGPPNSVSYLFDRKGQIYIDATKYEEDAAMEAALDAGAEDFAVEGEQYIVTTDPHSYNTIRNEYPDFGGQYEIEHYTTLLLKLMQQGCVSVAQQLKLRVTFHDPCHLGRFNKGYEAPREILRLLGCELIEMGRCRSNSFCCGAGGGRIWIPDPVGAEKPAQNRMREAARIEGLQVFVVSCPKDLTMFEDALKTSGLEGKFVVRELIELVREALIQ